MLLLLRSRARYCGSVWCLRYHAIIMSMTSGRRSHRRWAGKEGILLQRTFIELKPPRLSMVGEVARVDRQGSWAFEM